MATPVAGLLLALLVVVAIVQVVYLATLFDDGNHEAALRRAFRTLRKLFREKALSELGGATCALTVAFAVRLWRPHLAIQVIVSLVGSTAIAFLLHEVWRGGSSSEGKILSTRSTLTLI